MKDETFQASNVLVDGIRVPQRMFYLINWFETLTSLPALKENRNALRHMHYYYFGKDVNRPQVGDTRISFQCAGIPQSSTIGHSDIVSWRFYL